MAFAYLAINVQIYAGTYNDACEDEFHLVELFCGTSFGSSYANLAGAVKLNCQELGNYRCYMGECAPLINEMYDDFSSGVLSPTLWAETQDPEGQPFMGQHYVDPTNLYYHVENIGTHDQRIVLNLVGHTFQPGDKLEYDVDYVSGSGNRAIVLFINGAPTDRLVQTSNPYGGGSIGFNGQAFLAGNQFGQYHIKIMFATTGVHLEITRPDSSIYTETLPITTWNYAGNTYSSSPPWNIGFETWSNGAIQANYDNFVISHP